MLRKKLLITACAMALALALSTGPAFAKGDTSPPPPPPLPVPGALAPAIPPVTTTALPPLTQPGLQLRPFYGDISPFYGDISPFAGNVAPFWGDIAPFWGDISPFYGDIAPFWGDIAPFQGTVTPRWGDIAPFWNDVSPVMNGLRAHWGDIAPFSPGSPAHQVLQLDFQQLVSRSESFWGATVRNRTGQSFWDGFGRNVFARYGIDINNPATYSGLSQARRQQFLFDWYDGLMEFSGRDHVDYWMETARWTPSLTVTQGMGADTTIGLIDFTISHDADLLDNVIHWDGSQEVLNGHGGAVASLLVADHDNRGLMGIAPHASVAVYNPFDASGTANWTDITRGVVSVVNAGASVVNMSLGVPGSTFHSDWRQVYSSASVAPLLGTVVFVHAAGNEGVSQTQNIAWDFAHDPNLLVVGSVGPTGQISQFSNRPGNACLLDGTVCRERLMDRFLVAPGEWILTTDGQGGVTRRSGTSFAAPLVTGAIALLHDRWPWLAEHPAESVDLLLMTARDLGAPGVDPVYGRGLLDITASQSPLNFGGLYYYTVDKKLNLRREPIVERRNADARHDVWGAKTKFLVAYEDIGTTFRDFLIPLDSSLVGTTLSLNGRTELFQQYLYTSFVDWSRSGFTAEVPVSNPLGWDMRMSLSAPRDIRRDGDLPYDVALTLAGRGGLVLRAGRGSGAVALSTQRDVDASSFALGSGGADPILGLASGGAYVSGTAPLGPNTTVSVGFSQRLFEAFEIDPLSGEEMALFAGAEPYEAAATHLSLRHQLTPTLAMNAAYTFLHEDNGLLGVQSLQPSFFGEGSDTDAVTIGLEWSPNDRLSVSTTATNGRSREQSAGSQIIAITEEGVRTTAFEASVNLRQVFAEDDRARLRFVQPLHMESGAIDLTSVEVVDRSTGELGIVTERVELTAGARQFFLEGLYAAPVLDGAGEFSAFFRLDASPSAAEPVEEIVGAQFRIGF